MTLLFVCQVYPPDPAAVGQYFRDAAVAMARRGHRIVVLTADRGYDDPSIRFPSLEVLDGVEVRRVPFSSFGKGSIAARLTGGLAFVLLAVYRGLGLREADVVVSSTVPPFAPAAGIGLARLLSARLVHWVMDLNPDQMVALGVTREGSAAVRVFEALNRAVLRRAERVVVLDRFMAERVTAKLDVRSKLAVIPPWAHEEHVEPVPHAENPFRAEHGLDGRRVVMYSGNHGPSNPLTTLLDAAARLVDDPRLLFLFVGGGVRKHEVEERGLPNVRSLPYQPMETLRFSLSAADVHVVSVGDDVVGIVHPCKVYSAMAAARPLLLFGPPRNHVEELMETGDLGWHVAHGDVEGTVEVLREIAAAPAEVLAARGERGRALVERRLGVDTLCAAFCDLLEEAGTGGGGAR